VLLNAVHILKEASLVPSVFKRIILFAATQLYEVKYPPTRIFPSLCITIALTISLNQLHIPKEESLVPSAFKRIILFAAIHLYEVKFPPTRILLLLWVAIVLTSQPNPIGDFVLKLESILAGLADTWLSKKTPKIMVMRVNDLKRNFFIYFVCV
jgi:hypothetical protein